MKKKNIEKQSAERLKKIENLEMLLGKRKAEIKGLREEIAGLREVMGLMEALLYDAVKEKGTMQISRKRIKEDLEHNFAFELTNESFILRVEDI